MIRIRRPGSLPVMGLFFLEPLTQLTPKGLLFSATITVGIPAALNFKCQQKPHTFGLRTEAAFQCEAEALMFQHGSA